MRCRTLRTN